jgi:hypothetical protein
MKNINIKIIFIITTSGVIFFCSILPSFGEDWKTYCHTEFFINQYDASKLKYPDKEIIRIKTKETCKDREKCTKFYKETISSSNGDMNPAYERWASRISTVEIQCLKKQIRYLSVTNFDDSGNIIDSFDDPTDWGSLKNPWGQPNDPREELYKAVCE